VPEKGREGGESEREREREREREPVWKGKGMSYVVIAAEAGSKGGRRERG